MIIPIQIDPWTRRNFHHAPVSTKFVSLRNPFRTAASDRGNSRRDTNRGYIEDISFFTDSELDSEIYTLSAEINHRFVLSNGYYDYIRKAQYSTSGYSLTSGILGEMQEELGRSLVQEAEKFRKSFEAWDFFSRYNRENWRNMA